MTDLTQYIPDEDAGPIEQGYWFTKAYHAAGPGATLKDVAEAWGEDWNYNTLRKNRHLWMADGEPDFNGKPVEAKPRLFDIDIGTALGLEGDWLIIGDVHAPTTDLSLAYRVIDVAERRGITDLLIAGDMLNNDIFSIYPKKDTGVIPWQQEAAAARSLLLAWLDHFERIVWLAGNHERRLSYKVWGQLGMHDIRDIIIGRDRGVEVSPFGWCVIDTPQGEWRVTHPRNYSRIPMRNANKLAAKEHQHIWSFHEHHLGKTWDDSGRFLLVNGGGLFEWRLMTYVMYDDSTSPRMTKGFGVLKDGYAQLYGEEPYTNWRKVLNGSE